MYAEHPPVHHRAQGEIVEDFAAPPPDVTAAVLALTLVVEAVNLGDLPRLMVPANEGDALGISDLQCEQEQERLDAVKPPINEIAYGGRANERVYPRYT